MKKNIALILTMLIFAFAAPAHANHGIPPAPPAANEILIKVNGLVCDFCARAIEKVFLKQDGMDAVDVDLDHMEVRLHFLPEKSMDDEAIGKLIEDSGYNVVEIIRPEAG